MTTHGASHERVYEFLRNVGFRNPDWHPSQGQLWSVAGALPGGSSADVLCIPTPEGEFYLEVGTDDVRRRLRSILDLAELDEVPIHVTERDVHVGGLPRATWVAIALGLSAMALFGWVVISIGTRGG
jgi:hypothetical protein